MTEVYTVEITNLPKNAHSCFFYFNEVALRKLVKSECTNKLNLKIKHGADFKRELYVSFDPNPLGSITQANCVGITSVYAQRLGLKENDSVLISSCDANSLEAVYIMPKHVDDYEILVDQKSILEREILNQVRVVTRRQILPIHVCGNVLIDLVVEKLEPKLEFGILEQFTKLIIIDPNSRGRKGMGNLAPSIGPDLSPYETVPSSNIEESALTKLFTRLTAKENKQGKTEPVHEKWKSERIEWYQLRVVPLGALQREVRSPGCLVTHHDLGMTFEGPESMKSVWRLEVLEEKTGLLKSRTAERCMEGEKEDVFVPVVSLSRGGGGELERNNLYCPLPVMEKLKVSLGMRVVLVRVEEEDCVVMEVGVEGGEGADAVSGGDEEVFWSSMEEMRRAMVRVVEDNVALGQRMNALLVGGPGSGKTSVVGAVVRRLQARGVFCSVLPCKPLRGKSPDKLHRLWVERCSECAYRHPSLLVLDDLDAIMHLSSEESEVQFNAVNVARLGSLLSDLLRSFQAHSAVTVIATCQAASHLGHMSTTRGPRLFEAVLEVPEMSHEERGTMLRALLQADVPESVVDRTSGYCIQDVADLVERVELQRAMQGEADLEEALADTVPLSLRGVELHRDIPYRWSDVGGLSDAKRVLTEVFLWPSRHPDIFGSSPLRHQSGVLLFGAPGTGKTLLAGAVGNECGLRFISVKGPELLSKYVGASEEGVRNLFRRAQKAQPCVLFFDEFDSLAPRRGHDSTGVTDRVVNQLLTQLDGVEALTGVWVLAATSRPDLLDPALLRPGRLDRAVHCDLPNKDERLSILSVLSRKLSLTADVSLSEVADRTEGLTGADLQAVLYTAQMSCIKEMTKQAEVNGKVDLMAIGPSQLLSAVAETKPSLTPQEKLKYQRIYERFVKSQGGDFTQEMGLQQRVTFA